MTRKRERIPKKVFSSPLQPSCTTTALNRSRGRETAFSHLWIFWIILYIYICTVHFVYIYTTFGEIAPSCLNLMIAPGLDFSSVFKTPVARARETDFIFYFFAHCPPIHTRIIRYTCVVRTPRVGGPFTRECACNKCWTFFPFNVHVKGKCIIVYARGIRIEYYLGRSHVRIEWVVVGPSSSSQK